MKTVLLVLVFSLPIGSCKQKKCKIIIPSSILKEVQNLREANSISPLCIVFCDFTTSIDSTSINNVRNYAIKILKRLYDSFNIRFYSIDDLEFSPPFFESKCIAPIQLQNDLNIGSNNKDMINYVVSMQKDTLANNLNDKIKYLDTTQNLHNSCIINAVEKAIRLFRKNDFSYNSKCKLFILSDMLEMCKSSVGFINLEDGIYSKDLQVLKKKKIESISLKTIGIKSKNVEIIVCSDMIKQSHEFQEFWTNTFSDYGIDSLILSDPN